MKKFLIPLLSLLFFLPLPAFAQSPVNICINGYYIESDVDPFIEKNRVLVPIRLVSENLNGQVQWLPRDQKVLIHFYKTSPDEGKTLELGLNQKTVHIFHENGAASQEYTMDVAPKVIKNRIFLPLRFVTELMEESVTWDQANQTVIIGEIQNPIQSRGSLQVQWKDRTFPVKCLQVNNRHFISIQDFSQKMNFLYTIDRHSYSDYGRGPVLILTDPVLNKQILFQPDGSTECDRIRVDSNKESPCNQIYYNKEYYVPLDEIVPAFHWKSLYREDGHTVTLTENKEETSYSLSYDLLTPIPNTDELEQINVPSELYTIVYKNNHFYLMPMNRVFKDYFDEVQDLVKEDPTANICDDTHLYTCPAFFLHEDEKRISGMENY